jgi:hypothetical protein
MTDRRTEAVLAKAERKLEQAQRALLRLVKVQTYLDKEDAWEHVIFAFNQCFQAIEHLKKMPKVKPIFDQMLHLQRTDPLLSYMHQARNVEDHGVGPILSRRFESFSIGAPGENVIINSMRTDRTGRVVQLDLGAPATVLHVPGGIELHSIVNREREYPVPTTHLGKEISSDPEVVAQIALTYFRERCKEVAKALA